MTPGFQHLALGTEDVIRHMCCWLAANGPDTDDIPAFTGEDKALCQFSFYTL